MDNITYLFMTFFRQAYQDRLSWYEGLIDLGVDSSMATMLKLLPSECREISYTEVCTTSGTDAIEAFWDRMDPTAALIVVGCVQEALSRVNEELSRRSEGTMAYTYHGLYAGIAKDLCELWPLQAQLVNEDGLMLRRLDERSLQKALSKLAKQMTSPRAAICYILSQVYPQFNRVEHREA